MKTTLVASNSRLRLGVVGTGRWGSVILREASRVGDIDLVAAVSPSAPSKSFPIAGVEGFADLAQAVTESGIAAVVVAVPRSESARAVACALALGLHVLAEKPLCMLERECDYLYAKAREVGKVLCVDYTYLFHESVQSLLPASNAERTPTLELRVNDPGRRVTPADVVWDWGPHLISLMEAFGLMKSNRGEVALAVEETELSCDAGGWTLTAHTAPGRTGRLVLQSAEIGKKRTLRLTTAGGTRTVDLLRHTATTSPVRSSLQRFTDDVRRAGEGRGLASDENMTRAVTRALSAAAI